MDISAHAISLADRPQSGPLGSPVFAGARKTDLHRVSSSRRPRRVRVLATSSIAPHFVLFLCSCLAAVPSSRPARAGAPRARGRQGWPSRWPYLLLRRCQATPCRARARREDHAGRDAIASLLTHSKARSLVENRPGDAGELVGERNRQHVVVQSFLGGLYPGF